MRTVVGAHDLVIVLRSGQFRQRVAKPRLLLYAPARSCASCVINFRGAPASSLGKSLPSKTGARGHVRGKGKTRHRRVFAANALRPANLGLALSEVAVDFAAVKSQSAIFQI